MNTCFLYEKNLTSIIFIKNTKIENHIKQINV